MVPFPAADPGTITAAVQEEMDRQGRFCWKDRCTNWVHPGDDLGLCDRHREMLQRKGEE